MTQTVRDGGQYTAKYVRGMRERLKALSDGRAARIATRHSVHHRCSAPCSGSTWPRLRWTMGDEQSRQSSDRKTRGSVVNSAH